MTEWHKQILKIILRVLVCGGSWFLSSSRIIFSSRLRHRVILKYLSQVTYSSEKHSKTVTNIETTALFIFSCLLLINCLFLSEAPIQEENKCWKINVTIEYGTALLNNVTATRNQALSAMKTIAGVARAGLYLCRDVTVKLRDVQVTRGINVTSIMGVFHLVPKLLASKSLSSSAINCVKGAGIFVDLKAQPGQNAPKIFGGHSANAAVVTYNPRGLCCRDGLVESNGICGKWLRQ